MSERFYVNCLLQPGPVALEGPEAHHLAAVCRLRAGAAVCLFNGDGKQYPGVVAAVERKRVLIDVTQGEAPPRELPFALEVAVPLPKGDRAQFLVEKLTELGVTRLVPLLTGRSVVVPREGKQEKLERWVVEASKQCGRNILMEIAPPATWEKHVGRADLPSLRLLAHPGGQHMPTLPSPPPGVSIAIGPEGGFTDEEISLAAQSGWQLVTLGPRILRVETAAIAVAASLALQNGRPETTRE